MQISIEHEADPQDVAVVGQGLSAFNQLHTGIPGPFEKLHLFVRDEDGTIRGGLLGGTYWGWLYVSILWLHEDLRGQGFGSRLMSMAEDIARERGCHHAHLDTMSFQALGFYVKLGYSEWGRLEDMPRGHRRHFLQKALE